MLILNISQYYENQQLKNINQELAKPPNVFEGIITEIDKTSPFRHNLNIASMDGKSEIQGEFYYIPGCDNLEVKTYDYVILFLNDRCITKIGLDPILNQNLPIDWNTYRIKVCKKCNPFGRDRNFDLQKWWDKTDTTCPNCGEDYDK